MQTIILVVAVLVLVLALILKKVLFSKSSSSRGTTCLLLGLPNSGKTALFFRLKDGELKPTHTSIHENDATFELAGEDRRQQVHIIDVPGHSRVRVRFNHYLPITGTIVFMIDTIDFSTNVNQVGEYLYDLLTNGQIVRRQIPILIACNKSDISVQNKDFVKKKLALELNKLRETRSSAVQQHNESGSSSDDSQVDLVEDVKREFSFDDEQCLRTNITFTDLSVAQGSNVETVREFILSNGN